MEKHTHTHTQTGAHEFHVANLYYVSQGHELGNGTECLNYILVTLALKYITPFNFGKKKLP